MPFYDPQFGDKLKMLQSAVGFRFPPGDFTNTFLAHLLKTNEQTMSRKKKGKRLLTESDGSTLTDYFDLAQYGFEPDMWSLDLDAFRDRMQEVGRRALRESRPNESRKDLIDLATGGWGGRLLIEHAPRRTRGDGIGTEPNPNALPVFHSGDRVCVRLKAPRDGYLMLINDARASITCLMPSHYAPRMAVRAGDLRIPTTDEFPYFPVGGQPGRYRLYGLWFAERPTLSLTAHDGLDVPPRDVEPQEFIDLVGLALKASKKPDAVMVAYADYELR